MYVKSDRLTVERRVGVIFDLLTRGISTSDIMRYVSEKTDWNVQERQITNYITKARARYRETFTNNNEEIEAGKAKARLELCYRKAIKDEDWRLASQITKDINELFGKQKDPAVQKLELVNKLVNLDIGLEG